MKTIVLGAGIAGLAYANNANENEKIYVYEKQDKPGGLCRSFNIDGFVFDSAIHLSFTTNNIVRDEFDKVEYIKHFPIAYNFYKNRWIKHPIINNLSILSTDEKCELIESFINKEKKQTIDNYRDWLLESYGEKFVQYFYDVYTKKYWTIDANNLSTKWIGQRLTQPNFHKILYGAFEIDTGLDYYAKEMRYPKNGGYEYFLNRLIKDINISINKEVICIDTRRKRVYFNDNTEERYDKLVSSIPLCDMPFLIKETPDNVKEVAKKLIYTKISIVSVAFKKSDIPKYLWMYVYDPDIMAARINSPSMKSKYNAPEGYSSMQFEIYHRNDEVVNEDLILENVKYSIKKMNFCEEKDILFMDYRILPFGNVIFYNGMEKDRELVKKYIKNKGIQLIGRFGQWDYFWSDQSFLSGYNCAKSINSL